MINQNQKDDITEVRPVLKWAYRYLIKSVYNATYIFCTLIIMIVMIGGGVYIGMRHSDYNHAQKAFDEYKERTDDAIATQQVSINNLKIKVKSLENNNE